MELRLDSRPLPPLQSSSVTEVGTDLYALRPLSDEACAGFVDAVLTIEADLEARGLSSRPPNSMHRYGLVLGRWGLLPTVEAMVESVAPVAARYFPELVSDLTVHHAFVVHYAHDRDRALGFHVDDAHVTINLCLGTLFGGGDLLFSGRRCPRHREGPTHAHERIHYAHQPGVALMHAGAHRHEAFPLAWGRRMNLIVWCKDPSREDERGCTDWCGAREGQRTSPS